MDFCSTRNASARFSAAQAVLQGHAPDSGLFMPCALPAFSRETIMTTAAMSYARTAETVLSALLPGFSSEALRSVCKAAYGPQFDEGQITPLQAVRPGLWALELWHGPTGTGEDLALLPLPPLLAEAAARLEEAPPQTLLTALCGSTGLAALESFSHAPGMTLWGVYPQACLSPLQRLQAVTQLGDSLQVFGVTADEADAKIAIDRAAQGIRRVDGAGWACLAARIVWYFRAYARLLNTEAIEMGDPVNFVVPTGELGSLLAGLLAKRCGLPVGRLICAVNENSSLFSLLQDGVFDGNRPFRRTAAADLDISVPAELERLLFLLYGDGEPVTRRMAELERKGAFRVDEALVQRLRNEGLLAFWCDDAHTFDTMRELWFGRGYLCDPHTGVAMHAYHRYTALTGDKAPTVALSVSSPFRFAAAVLPAIGLDFQGDAFQQLEALEIVSGRPAPAALKALKTRAPRFSEILAPEELQKRLRSRPESQ